ncbi:uncharacterized protein LOC123292313 [Chrysoperla carnea]|uniref:uncharacterized protein LOC123292313 n=1 Tax=Chrysoperla carnea TaxID=189513 RepID=UPI001D067D6D|nr:uncharacterized protein LOC123292313 [Chrysoperla carnea]
MDVTITNGLEGVRQYFQGLPTTSNPSGNSTPFHSTDQYNTDNIESNIWSTTSGNGSRIPNDQQFPKNPEPNKSIFNHVVNTESSNSYSLFERNESSSQYKNVSLPKHEMRPHNHEIWKPSSYERVPSATSDTNTSKLNSDDTKPPNQQTKVENDKKLSGNLNPNSSTSFQDEFQQQMLSSLNKNFDQHSQNVSSQHFDRTSGGGKFPHQDSKNVNNETSKTSETQSGSDKSLLTRQISSESISTVEKRSPSVEIVPPRPSSQSQEARPASINHQDLRLSSHEMRPPSHEMRPPSHEMRPPSHEMRPSPHEIRPPSHEMRPVSQEVRPPSCEMRAASQEMRPASHEMRPASHEMRPASHEMRPASHEMRPASHEMRPASHEMRPASHEMRPASHEMRPASHEMRPASHDMRPASHEMRSLSQEMRVPSHEMRPSSQEMRPAPQEIRPPTQEMRPASQDMRPASQEMRQNLHDVRPLSREIRPTAHEIRQPSHEMRPPSHEMRPASHEMRPPSHEMRPSSRELRPSSHEMRPASHEMRPPSHEMRPTSHEMRPPSHEMRPPSHEMRPPSHEMRPGSHEMRPVSQEMRLTPQDMRQSSHEMKPNSHEMRTQGIRQPSHEIRQNSHDMRLQSHEMRPDFVSSHQVRPEFRDTNNRLPKDMMPQPQLSHDIRSRSLQEIRSLPEEKKLTGMYASYAEERLAQDSRINPELRHLQEQYSQRTQQDLRSTAQKMYDNRSFPPQDIRAPQNIKSFSNEVRLPTTNKEDPKQLSQDYLKSVQLKSSFEARMSKSINQAFNENHYGRPMNSQIQTPSNNMYSMETKGPNEMQYKMDQEAKKLYTARPIDQTTRVPPTSVSGNDLSRINKPNLPTSNLNNYHQTPSSEYLKKDPNYMARSMAMMNQYNKSLPPTDNRLQPQHTMPPRVASNMNDFQKQYLQHTTNTSRPEKLVQRSAPGVGGSSSQQPMHFTNYTPEQHSYPTNVLQRHSNVIQYENSSRQQNASAPGSSDRVSGIKIEQRPEMMYPPSTINQQNHVYHQNSLRQQPQSHDKKLSRMEIDVKVSTQNSIAYSRAYNNYPGHTTQTTSSSAYNQMANQYTTTGTKSINHQEAYERQRLYNNHIQTLQQQKNPQNHHEVAGTPGLYPQSYQQQMRNVETSRSNNQQSSISMQHQQQMFQTAQSSSTKNTYPVPPRASGPMYSSHSNVQHQLRPEIIVTTAGGVNNTSGQQHFPYSTSSSADNHLQHYMQQTKGLYYPSNNKTHSTPYPTGTVSTNSIIERQRQQNQMMNANYKNPAYRYPSPSAPGAIVTSSNTNQYHYANKNYSYVTTNASMSNYTTTSSSMNSVHNSTVLTNSNHHYLQQAAIAQGVSKSSSSQQKVLSNQTAPIQMNRQSNYPPQQTVKSIRTPTIDLTSPSATPKPVNKINSVSPLDLSVKTVRTSADSTANDDYQIIEQSNEMYNYQQRLPKISAPGVVGGNNGIAAAPKVDFAPNFTTLAAPITTTRSSSSTSSSEMPGVQKSYENRTAYYQNYHLQRGGATNKVELVPSKRQPQYVPQPPIPQIPPQINKKRYADESSDYQPHAKIPRVDNWRLSIDQEIDQRLLSYTHSKSQLENQQGYKPLINGHSTLQTQPPSAPEHQHQVVNAESRIPYNHQAMSVQNESKNFHQVSPGHNTTTVQSNSYPPSNISGGNQPPPSVHGADKRVISILRNSLEIKGAKQREEQERIAAKSDIIVQNNIPTPPVVTTSSTEIIKSSAFVPTTVGGASSAPTKFHIPRAIDSIKVPPTTVPSEVVPISDTSATEVKPTSNADLDGLAANLAARIRTKAELKQVDPAQLAAMQKANEENNTTPSSETSKDQQPPRRRLFSRTDEDGNTIPHRNSILRSSSEVSVFDFRESDSESEMPILERQSLVDMRRDRKSSTSTIRPPSATPLDPDIVIKQEVPESPDPFFTETCDKFMEQLRTGGSSTKKRGRRKKVVEPEIIAKLENKLIEIEIKVEKCDDIIKCEPSEPNEPEPPPEVKPVENEFEPDKVIKQEDSDSDVPLIRKKYALKKNEEANSKKSDDEDDDDDEVLSVMKKKEKSGAKIKLESSSESSDNSDNETNKETVAHRLRQRKGRSNDKKRSDSESSTNITTRATNNNESKEQKNSRSKSAPQKKPSFGDGSDFRPGWEEEVYRYKQSLRMPAQLISIPRPTVRLSTSLPDLDPCPSPTTSSIMDNEFFKYHMKNNLLGAKIKREFIDSDLDSNFSFVSQNKTNTVIDDEEEATCSSILSSTNSKTKENNNSIIDVLAQRYGKNNLRKRTSKKFNNNNNRPKIIPKSSNPLELLPTPSLEDTVDVKNDKKKVKSKKLEKPISPKSNTSLLGFFRKKTVENFRDAFRKNTINEQFTPVIFKSRTRKETQVLKQRATMREVFGEDRPASAPPMTNHVNEEAVQPAKKSSPKPSPPKKKKSLVKVTSKSKKENTVPGRAGLRSAIALRGHHHRAVIKNKRNLTKKQLIKVKKLRSDKTKTLSESKKEKILKDQKQFNKTRGSANVNNSSSGGISKNRKLGIKTEKLDKSEKSVDDVIVDNNKEIVIKTENDIKIENNTDIKVEGERKLTGKKKYKLKSIRRKFSSGFDYIRKKKKPLKKENLEQNGTEQKKPKKRGISQRTNAVTIQDIQREIKGWVLNKGIGETHLHRASRLGYTDVTAYCLETLGNAPSPKDNAGYTPLLEACSRGHLDIAKLLLLYGANENEFAQGGIRPLHEASENGYVEIIRLLLSYGADPLFPTYSGLTPLSLATDNDTISVLQNYIADIQGKDAPPWIFPGPAQFFETEEQGYDALEGAPSPDPSGPNSELDMEVSEAVFPNLYTLRGEDPDDKWVLLQDLSNLLKCKSKDALLRLLNSSSTDKSSSGSSSSSTSSTNHKNIVKDMKMADFLDQAHCCSLLSAGERVNIRASKISLVKYSDRVKELLGIEDFILPPTR